MLNSVKPFLLSIVISTIVGGCASVGAGKVDSDESFSFRVIGDLPYNETQIGSLKYFITPKIKDTNFIIHVGDFKAGTFSPCDAATDQRHKDWMTSLGIPVFYTPGDNDWTDCDIASNAPVLRETERLETLRNTFFGPIPTPVPETWEPEWHSGLPENASWRYNNVRFATIHLVGRNNGRTSMVPCAVGTVCDTQADVATVVAAREKGNTEWLITTFEKAKREGADAVVIATHSDMYDTKHENVPCVNSAHQECDGFKSIRKLLVEESSNFEKPVLLVHGDTSPYCWDYKFGGGKAENLHRLNSAGDFVLVDAVQIDVDLRADRPFTAKTLLTDLSPAENTCRQ